MTQEPSLHEQLTNLLMDAGATVNKTCVDELIRFIARRDDSILEKIKNDVGKVQELVMLETKTSGE